MPHDELITHMVTLVTGFFKRNQDAIMTRTSEITGHHQDDGSKVQASTKIKKLGLHS
jgi:hypothetical protein